jgi:serine/threonine protein kinase
MTKAQREIAILKKASHPNVAKLIEVISDMEGEMLFVAMEYIDGSAVMQWDGDREAYLAVASDGAFASHVASNLGQQLLQGLEYLHRHRVAHRDLKPDNLILSSSGRLVIVDFGVSCIFEEEVASGQVKNCVSSGTGGALAFRAPEIFSLHQSEHISYDAFKADIWAAGVCLWAFFFAKLPFYSPDPVELRRQILEDPLNYPTPPQSMCSFLTTLLESLLQRDPSCRASAEQGMLHPCFSECFKNPDDLPQDSNQVVAISEVDLAGAIKRVNHLALISMVRYRMRRRLLEARQVLSERHLAEVRLSKTAVEPPKKVKRGPPMEAWTNSSIGRRSLSESEIIIERTRPQAPAGDNGCLVS